MEAVVVGLCTMLLLEFQRSRLRLLEGLRNSSLVASQGYIAAAGSLRTSHVRIPLFYEEWIDKYLEYDFFILFRMTQQTMNLLLSILGPLHVRTHTGGSVAVPLEKALMMTVWYLGKGEVLVSVSDRFGVSLSTTHKVIAMIVEYLSSLRGKLIMWPSRSEAVQIAMEFNTGGGYPDVIGAIDGTHLPIKPPKDQHDSYLDRKFVHSIVLQGTCTFKKFLTNVYIGFPGSAHDARVLRESELFKKIEREGAETFFYGSYHLIGDSAYPCQNWLMTPYRDTGRLTEAQKLHNQILSRTRVVIENAFGLLKGRWRILKYINVNSIRRGVQIATACCVLHNFCLLHEDFFEVEDADDDGDDGADSTSTVDLTAQSKRNQIAEFLRDTVRLAKRRRV